MLPPPAIQVKKPISLKLKMFVESYLITWSATEAARRAAYSTPNKSGPRIMKRADVQAAVSERIKQAAMEADEVLARFSEQARVNINDFIICRTVSRLDKNGDAHDVEIVDINWDAVRERGYLIKKVSWDKAGNPNIELHDGQNALIQLGKHLKLFTDVEINVNTIVKGYVGISPDDWDDEPTP